MDERQSPDAYRAAQVRCPQCRALMETRRIALDADTAADVDVCGECGGIFIDAWDGDVRDVTRHTLFAEDPPLAGAEDDDARPLCARCETPLDMDLAGSAAAILYTCESCKGVFVTRLQAERLAHGPSGPQNFKWALVRAKTRR